MLLTVSLLAAALPLGGVDVAPAARAASSSDGGNATLPDLRAASVWASNTTPVEGEWVRVTANVTNDGDAPADNFTIRFVLDGNQTLEEFHWATLSAGEWASVTIHWRAEAGDHTITAEADPDDRVGESNEANNRAGTTLHVREETGLPDLVVLDLVTRPDAPREGDNVTIHARVANKGNATAGSSTLEFEVTSGDTTPHYVPVGELPPGEAAWVRATWPNVTAGNHTIAAFADRFDEVNESEEANNARKELVRVAPALPDIVVEAVKVAPAPPEDGDEVAFQARIHNDANVSAGAFDVWFMVDGAWHDTSARVSGLAAGERVVVESAPWRATAGNHTITVVVDPRGEVNETRTWNNNRTWAFHVDRGYAERTLVHWETSLGGASAPDGNASVDVTHRYPTDARCPFVTPPEHPCPAVPRSVPGEAHETRLTVEAAVAVEHFQAGAAATAPYVGQWLAVLP